MMGPRKKPRRDAAGNTILRRRTSFEIRLLLITSASLLPVALLSLYLAYRLGWSGAALLVFGAAILAGVFAQLRLLRRLLQETFGAMRNMVAALRQRDYSIRLRPSPFDDLIDGLIDDVNSLADTLQDQRLAGTDAGEFLLAVLREVDAAIFAFDPHGRLRLANRSAEQLMMRSEAEMLEKEAESLGLAEYLELRTTMTVERTFPAGHGRWIVSRAIVRDGGQPNRLVFVADLGRALRRHERDGWQQLVRVLGHELNNSLAPIRSFASTLESLLQRHREPTQEMLEDVRHGLSVISNRSSSLMRFMEAYSRLVCLPKPVFRPVRLERLIRSVTALHHVATAEGPDVIAAVDEHQVEQLLVNVVKNAVEAAASAGGVSVRWEVADDEVVIRVLDDGPGLPEAVDPFAPLFSTKGQGSGIGLTLSRHITDGHGGSILLQNRAGGGCEAIVTLPL